MARILVVDDETNIRLTIRLALQQSGHAVETASDGPEALTIFESGGKFDLVLLDQRMPGMEGIEVLREMRRRDPGSRIVMVTAFGTIDLAVTAMKEGATDFLRKPFTIEVLRGAVRSAVDYAQPAESGGLTFGSTTVNGFRIEFNPRSARHGAGAFSQAFTVHDPAGISGVCTVELPNYIRELVIAHTDQEEAPGGDRFWQSVCEEALANFLWQNAEIPPGGDLRIEELTTGLRRFVDAIVAA